MEAFREARDKVKGRARHDDLIADIIAERPGNIQMDVLSRRTPQSSNEIGGWRFLFFTLFDHALIVASESHKNFERFPPSDRALRYGSKY